MKKGLLKYSIKTGKYKKPIIEEFNGRFIKELGDGILASFNAVSDAVHAAIKIQQQCTAGKDFQLRIGIHLGEVVFENDDVFGDGVNIASRIQAIAEPGEIYISESVQLNIINKQDITTQFVRQQNLKNVKEPAKIYRILTTQIKPRETVENKITANTGNSIAVLPFANISNDPEQEYFCDGIAEEILNALAQVNNLRVVARTSAFSFKNKNLDVREIGKALDVKTLLEGSVRKAEKQLRVTTKLLKVADGSHLWSNRYDCVLEDIFSVQENIAGNVATALKGLLTTKEKEAIRRPETIIEAYDYFLKGRQLFHQLALHESRKMFEKAIELDAGYAPAYAGLAAVNGWLYEWVGGNIDDLIKAEQNSRQALSLAPGLSDSHSSRGYILSLDKKYDEAEREFEEAIRLNPNSYDAYYHFARSCFARGQIQRSADLFRKASEVNREDFQSLLLLAQSLRMLGKDKTQETVKAGINRAKKQLELNPTDRRALSLTPGSMIEIGEKEKAFQWINKALDLYPEDVGVLVNAACLFAKNGDKDKALDLLEKVFGKGFGKKDWIQNDPDYDSLRNEPRFQALLARLR